MDSVDRLLSEVKAEYEGVDNSAFLAQPTSSSLPEITRPALHREVNSDYNNLLAELKAEYQTLEPAEVLLQNPQHKTQIQQLQSEKSQSEKPQSEKLQSEQLVQKHHAIAWLKQLDPLSNEGLWFEEFAGHYPSKIDAAIEYLQTLHSPTRPG